LHVNLEPSVTLILMKDKYWRQDYQFLNNNVDSLPHNEAHKISELNLFLYFLISGVSDVASWVCAGVTFTLIWDPRRDWLDWLDCEPTVEPLLAPNPNAEKDLWWRIDGVLLTAWRYWNTKMFENKVHCNNKLRPDLIFV
jgi:hypothetical protein